MTFFFRLIDLLPVAIKKIVLRWLIKVALQVYADMAVTGLKNVPDEPILFICNHLSNADALVLRHILWRHNPSFLAGIKLQGTTMTRLGLAVVDTISVTPNSADIEAIKKTVQALRTGKSVVVFPEGTRSRTGHMAQGKAGICLIVSQAKVRVVPIGIMGTEKLLPIRDDNMGSETPHHAKITVRIGEVFTLDDIRVTNPDGKEDRQATADAMMHRIAALLDPDYQGIYRE